MKQKCSLGFTFKQSSANKEWKVSKIKEGGWADKVCDARSEIRSNSGQRMRFHTNSCVWQSKEVASGDILISLDGKECKDLSLIEIILLLQVTRLRCRRSSAKDV